MGADGMQDRSSRPHRSPARTPLPLVRRIVHLRWKQRLSPVAIGVKLGMPASTVHAVLVRCRLHRLWHVDRATGEPVRRYEHDTPGALIHVDVKKLGNIPDGGGHRYLGRDQDRKNRRNTTGKPRNAHYARLMGTAFVSTTVLAAPLQPPPTPLRHRSPTTHHPIDQPPWTAHLEHEQQQ